MNNLHEWIDIQYSTPINVQERSIFFIFWVFITANKGNNKITETLIGCIINSSPKLISHNRYDTTVLAGTTMVLTWYRHFKQNGGLNPGFTAC